MVLSASPMISTMVDYADRLAAAMAEAKISTAELARRVGSSYQAVKKILDRKSGSMSAANNAKAAAVLGVQSDWLASGTGPRYPVAHFSGIGQAGGSGSATLSTGAQAHDLSHHRRKMPWKRYSWEQIMRGEDLEAEFIGAVPDDALAPDYPAGTDVIWSQAKDAKTGSLLLLRDQRGGLHVRQRRQAKNDYGWCAAVIHPAYEAFEPGEVTIIAVGLQVLHDLP